MILREVAQPGDFFSILIPLPQSASAEVVLEVSQEFFKGGLGDINKLYFGLGISGGGGDALGDILLAATGCLNHLVNGTISFREVFLAEMIG